MKKAAFAILLPLFIGACATSPRPAPSPSSVPSLAIAQPNADAAEYRVALEEAYQQILARSSGSVKAPVVDAEAILSLPIPQHRSITGALDYFSTDRRDQIQRSLTRSSQYRGMIEQVLDEYRIPRALGYLPVIESAYIPTLTSKAGAHGMWQFMPATGREYGLELDWWVDERADTEKSTRAAAKFLRDLYREFGDWSLALAAYNCGPGRVRRAMNETGASTFWELLEASALPKETRGYVPTFYATIIIVSDPQAYGFVLTEPETVTQPAVDVEGPVSFDYLAEVTGIDNTVFRSLNPQFRRNAVPPGRNTVRVPRTAVETLSARATQLRYEDPHLAVSSFTLRDGDSIAKLARVLKVGPDEIRSMNRLRNDRVAEGRSIYLPVSQTALSDLMRKSSAPEARHYTVRQGDTLYSIAKRNGLSVEELVDLNRLGARTIHPGDKLRVTASSAMTAGGM